MTTTGFTAIAFGLAAWCAAGLSAQSPTTQTTTKTTIEMKGGKDVTVIGCLEQRANGDYFLTEMRDNSRRGHARYSLLTSKDLSKHVGERVEITGKTATKNDGTVSVESKTKTEAKNRKDQETETKTEGTTGVFAVPYLGVSSIKTLSSFCK